MRDIVLHRCWKRSVCHTSIARWARKHW